MRKSLVCLGLSMLLLGACSDGPDVQKEPKAALVAAFKEISEHDGSTVIFTVGSDIKSILALDPEEPVPTEAAQTILDSSLSISGNNPENPRDSRSRMALNIDGKDMVELRVIGPDLFGRAEVQDLVEAFGGDAKKILASAGELAEESGLSFLKPAIDGKWIVIRDMDRLSEQLGQQTPSPAEQRRLVENLSRSLRDKAKVQLSGTDDIGTRLDIRIPARDLFTGLTKALEGFLPEEASLPDAAEIPNEDVKLNAWLDDGVLEQVEFDLSNNAELFGEDVPAGVERFALVMRFEEFDGEVEEPEGAVDAAQSFFGSLLGGALQRAAA